MLIISNEFNQPKTVETRWTHLYTRGHTGHRDLGCESRWMTRNRWKPAISKKRGI